MCILSLTHRWFLVTVWSPVALRAVLSVTDTSLPLSSNLLTTAAASSRHPTLPLSLSPCFLFFLCRSTSHTCDPLLRHQLLSWSSFFPYPTISSYFWLSPGTNVSSTHSRHSVHPNGVWWGWGRGSMLTIILPNLKHQFFMDFVLCMELFSC